MKDENNRESVDSTLPKPEPLMPGADIPHSEPPERYESHQNSEKSMEEFFVRQGSKRKPLNSEAAYRNGKRSYCRVFFGLVLFDR